jgi:hypothetical protein
MIRDLRHGPPGSATRGARRATFNAALEQAEQLFIAAENVGPAARPLLVFYGISQAGRAVASASNVANTRYRLTGHGITTIGMNAVHNTGLARLALQDDGSGAFTELADILNCASLPDVTELGSFWNILPELRRFPLPGAADARAIRVHPAPTHQVRTAKNALVELQFLPDDLAYAPPDDKSADDPADLAIERRRVEEFIGKYPTLADYNIQGDTDAPIWKSKQPGSRSVQIEWQFSATSKNEEQEIESRTIGHHGQRYAFPAIGGSSRPAHPFLIWWAISYALSMLARYEPNVWLDRISISSSADATAVEYFLNQAITIVPETIHRAIIEVS